MPQGHETICLASGFGDPGLVIQTTPQLLSVCLAIVLAGHQVGDVMQANLATGQQSDQCAGKEI